MSLNNEHGSIMARCRRLPEFAFIRTARHDQTHIEQRMKSVLNNLPKSHVQIPASIFLNHHRQKQQQFASPKSAFRPIQSVMKGKRASSEGHSPSISSSSSSTSLNIDHQSLSKQLSKAEQRRRPPPPPQQQQQQQQQQQEQQRRRRRRRHHHQSCDLSVPIVSSLNSTSLTRSVCDSSSAQLKTFSRTMSDILCDQFSEINLDAIERDCLLPQATKISCNSHPYLFSIVNNYRSSRASFAVERGDLVHLLKQVGRACVLVRKQNNGQIGFIPRALLAPTVASSRIETFLEMHEYRETII
jgi:hypothetical protein